jgi:hypothetical protein
LFLPVPAPEEEYNRCENECACDSTDYSTNNCTYVGLIVGAFCVDGICLDVNILKAVVVFAVISTALTRVFMDERNTDLEARIPNAAPWIALCKLFSSINLMVAKKTYLPAIP